MTVHDHSIRTSETEAGRAPVSTGPAPEVSAGWAPPIAPNAGASGPPPVWTPPEASGDAKPGKRRGKLAVAGAIVAAAVASAGVTAGIMAGDNGTSTAAASGPGGGQGFAGRQGGPGGAAGGMAGGLATALHGTYVVADGNGGYTTQLTQTGTVSAVSASSITVKSLDGFTKTYLVSGSTSVDSGSDAIADVTTGHTVRVVASSANDQATATQIQDTDLASTTQQGGTQQGGTQQGGTQQGGQGAPAGGTQQGGTGT